MAEQEYDSSFKRAVPARCRPSMLLPVPVHVPASPIGVLQQAASTERQQAAAVQGDFSVSLIPNYFHSDKRGCAR
jgi:hypothetical protein